MHWVYVSCQRAEAAAAVETGGDVGSESPSQRCQRSPVHPLRSHAVTSSPWLSDVTSCVCEATEAFYTWAGLCRLMLS